MLSNAYLLAKIGADTAENEQRFAEILPTDALCPPARPERSPALLGLTPAGQGCRHALHLGSLFGQKTTRPGGVHFSACLPAHYSDYNVIEPYFLANVRKNYFDISRKI